MGQGSTGNVIAAICSFLIPGLGQLVQGRVIAAIIFFLIGGFFWLIGLPPIGHIIACLNAALWRGPRRG